MNFRAFVGVLFCFGATHRSCFFKGVFWGCLTFSSLCHDCCRAAFFVISQDAQLGTGKTVKMAIGQAVKDGLVDNETLGYFMTRTQLFLEMASCCRWGW